MLPATKSVRFFYYFKRQAKDSFCGRKHTSLTRVLTRCTCHADEAELTQQPPRQVEVSLGGGVTLQCAGAGSGAVAEAAAHGDLEAAAAAAATSANCWGRVTTGGRLEPAGVGPELRLDNILYEEAGSYRCVPAQPRPELNERRALTPPDVEVVVTGEQIIQ
jgi:hypothetical protein